MGGILLCRGQLGLQVRAIRRAALRFLGRADDSVHLPIRQTLPRTRTPGAYPRRNHARPAWPFQPDDPGWLQHRRQHHQPDGQLHGRRRPGRRAVTTELHPWGTDRRFRCAVLHALVRLPFIGNDRLRPADGHDPRGGHHHSDDLLHPGRASAVHRRHAPTESGTGILLLQDGLPRTGRPLLRGRAGLCHRQPDHRPAPVRRTRRPDQADLHHRHRRLRRHRDRPRHAGFPGAAGGRATHGWRPQQPDPADGRHLPAALRGRPAVHHGDRFAVLDRRL